MLESVTILIHQRRGGGDRKEKIDSRVTIAKRTRTWETVRYSREPQRRFQKD
jgi:hypothetical protein